MFMSLNPRKMVCWFYVGVAAVCMLAIIASAETGLTGNFGELVMNAAMVMVFACLAGLIRESYLWDNKKPPPRERAGQWTEDEL